MPLLTTIETPGVACASPQEKLSPQLQPPKPESHLAPRPSCRHNQDLLPCPCSSPSSEDTRIAQTLVQMGPLMAQKALASTFFKVQLTLPLPSPIAQSKQKQKEMMSQNQNQKQKEKEMMSLRLNTLKAELAVTMAHVTFTCFTSVVTVAYSNSTVRRPSPSVVFPSRACGARALERRCLPGAAVTAPAVQARCY